MSPTDYITSKETILNQAEGLRQELLSLVDNPAPAPNSHPELIDTRILGRIPLIPAHLVEERLPLTDAAAQTTLDSRVALEKILKSEDDRLAVVVGPCSIHNIEEALEYAQSIKELREKYSDDLEIVMRCYTEKPRSTIGWEGMVADPKLTGLFDPENAQLDFNLGLIASRMLHLAIADMGVPVAIESLNHFTPTYRDGLVAYETVGARNSSDQNTRGRTSGTSCVLGVKHREAPATDTIQAGFDSLIAVRHGRVFVGTDKKTGALQQVPTSGHSLAHLVLRGGTDRHNYSQYYIRKLHSLITRRNSTQPVENQLLEACAVDLSHGNSRKVAGNQVKNAETIARYISGSGIASKMIKIVMIESYLQGGKQSPKSIDEIEPGVSVTDECIGMDRTREVLRVLATAVRTKRERSLVN